MHDASTVLGAKGIPKYKSLVSLSDIPINAESFARRQRCRFAECRANAVDGRCLNVKKIFYKKIS